MNEGLARFLYDRQADSYDADPEMREKFWTKAFVKDSWLDEAAAILDYLETTV